MDGGFHYDTHCPLVWKHEWWFTPRRMCFLMHWQWQQVNVRSFECWLLCVALFSRNASFFYILFQCVGKTARLLHTSIIRLCHLNWGQLLGWTLQLSHLMGSNGSHWWAALSLYLVIDDRFQFHWLRSSYLHCSFFFFNVFVQDRSKEPLHRATNNGVFVPVASQTPFKQKLFEGPVCKIQPSFWSNFLTLMY